MKNTDIRTDLAVESGAPLGQEVHDGKGFTYHEQMIDEGCTLAALEITGEAGEARFGRPAGHYITFSFPVLWETDDRVIGTLKSRLAHALYTTVKDAAGSFRTLLTVGLGNRSLTADAVGPMTVDRLLLTRHLPQKDADAISAFSLAALAPGVAGQTGMETAELVAAAVQAIRPDAVIAIDALAARSTERLLRTVQIADTGIAPGSGVGNHRSALNARTLGVPVIAVGVPTVVSSATLVRDAFEQAALEELPPELETVLQSGDTFFVTPKDADVGTDALSSLLADAVNAAFCPALF